MVVNAPFRCIRGGVVGTLYDRRNPFRVRGLLHVEISAAVFYTERSTAIWPPVLHALKALMLVVHFA